MQNTTLYLYEFNTTHFTLIDENAGYYISEQKQNPIKKIVISNPSKELSRRNVELLLVDNLWDISDEIQQTSLNWSMCRMSFAQHRDSFNEKRR
ncbi:hypothetical protein MPH47_15835 [Psychrobacillus psychrodurans]|nr:DUF6886 family protein [Psychrobacillus psychrodurans]MCK1998675.1 hypothetical protein [Psychrobacillus psychrodurans]